jgi:hypothetical protein
MDNDLAAPLLTRRAGYDNHARFSTAEPHCHPQLDGRSL